MRPGLATGKGTDPMRCQMFRNASEFWRVAARSLAEHEAENTVLVGRVLHCMRTPKRDSVMAVVEHDQMIRLAAVMIPPHALVLSVGDAQAIAPLVEALRAAGIRPTGVFGLEPIAKRFAALWQNCGPAAAPEMRTILYCCSQITAPTGVPGDLRVATPRDIDWLADWQRRFAEQASLTAAEQTADMRAVVTARVARGEMHVWSIEGKPVSCAAFATSTTVGDAGRINAVFTPEDERGKGYASACIAALGQRLLEGGWRYCLIFADRANPTTNRMYRRLGCGEVAAFATIGFQAPA